MKITLCGSTRFMDQYDEWNRWLALRGHVVYSVAGSAKHGWEITDDEKETLDLVHVLKIYNSDAILVINCLRMPEDFKHSSGMTEERWGLLTESYIGSSTKREIKWAKMTCKKSMYTTNCEPQDFKVGPS